MTATSCLSLTSNGTHAAFRKTPHFSGKADNRKMVGMTTKLKFIDRVKAMELLGKAKGWFK